MRCPRTPGAGIAGARKSLGGDYVYFTEAGPDAQRRRRPQRAARASCSRGSGRAGLKRSSVIHRNSDDRLCLQRSAEYIRHLRPRIFAESLAGQIGGVRAPPIIAIALERRVSLALLGAVEATLWAPPTLEFAGSHVFLYIVPGEFRRAHHALAPVSLHVVGHRHERALNTNNDDVRGDQFVVHDRGGMRRVRSAGRGRLVRRPVARWLGVPLARLQLASSTRTVQRRARSVPGRCGFGDGAAGTARRRPAGSSANDAPSRAG